MNKMIHFVPKKPKYPKNPTTNNKTNKIIHFVNVNEQNDSFYKRK